MMNNVVSLAKLYQSMAVCVCVEKKWSKIDCVVVWKSPLCRMMSRTEVRIEEVENFIVFSYLSCQPGKKSRIGGVFVGRTDLWQNCIAAPNPPPCDSSPCGSGGTCENTENGYKCKCPPGWTGDNCDVREYLSVVRICFVRVSEYSCWTRCCVTVDCCTSLHGE